MRCQTSDLVIFVNGVFADLHFEHDTEKYEMFTLFISIFDRERNLSLLRFGMIDVFIN